jgi:hypothetical protein
MAVDLSGKDTKMFGDFGERREFECEQKLHAAV